ncbi:Na+/H+ antiporter [Amnibacterium kyonggiense]|uniref:Sodium/proton antiporter (CPA1 family) n=1 Tax=Amnibacterium kyonggiense TaxID=595671 RepID=A0A4R7FSJ8_9MICO|nr:Na+/H+ antiporter [Amnibacterium kyonggiense]TDS80776.1 sodium/proton antiporter (CPA1 family) [Amnibacterium kyonggiense]
MPLPGTKGRILLGLELVVVLGAVVLAVGALARRIRVAPPIVLLVAGVVLGFLPLLRDVALPPEVVLLLFLPVLLYWESLTTSLREIRSNLRSVLLTSTVLVVVTAAAVAVAAHAVGLDWGAAWVLGAAVAPTDATATGALAGALPRRTLTALRAESLVNDGTALVLLAVAVQAAVGREEVTALQISGLVLLSYVGGIALGLLVAALETLLRRRIDDPLQENVVTVLAPFTAYLLAELVGASGVLAVVVCGLAMSQIGPRVGRADTRVQTNAFWTLTTYLLNGALFVLVGIELHAAARGLDTRQVLVGVGAVALITAVVVAVRFAFLFGSAGTIHLLTRRRPERGPRQTNRDRLVRGTAGFRGAVSLAAALSVPTAIASGRAFPDRDLVIFITAGVVGVTLVLQGLLLPLVLRRAALPPDEDVEHELEDAEIAATTAALESLPAAAESLGVGEIAVERSRRELEAQLRTFRSEEDDDLDEDQQAERDYAALRLALVRRKREVILGLRDERRIDDIVLRRIQARLDNEEVRLAD